MVLTVGTDAYVAVTDVAAYASARDIDGWDALTTAKQEAAVREATEYLDNAFQWRGYLLDQSQALGWPRRDVYDREGRPQIGIIPSYVKNACCELAILAMGGRLAPMERAQSTGGGLKKVSVGDLTEEYFENATTGGDYDYIRIMLRGLGIPRNTNDGQVSLTRT